MRRLLDHRYQSGDIAVTDATGNFLFTEIATGHGFGAETRNTTGWWRRFPGSEADVALLAPQDYTLTALVVDRMATITGSVTDDQTPGVGLVGVTLQQQTLQYYSWQGCLCYYRYADSYVTQSATTDAAGNYTLFVQPGNWVTPQPFAHYQTPGQFYENVPFGGTHTVAPLTYRRNAVITGTIDSDTGSLPQDVVISWYGYTPSGYTSGNTTVSGGVGSYSIEVPTNYVSVWSDTFEAGFGYSDNGSGGYQRYYGSPAPDATTTGADFHFHSMGTITGAFTKPDGTGGGQRAHFYVYVQPANGRPYYACSTYDDYQYDPAYCYSDPATGAFSIQVMAGTATIYENTTVSGYGKSGPSVTVTVTSGQTTTGADQTFVPWVHVKGSIEGDIANLGGSTIYGYAYDQWGRSYFLGYQYPNDAKGSFDYLSPVGSVQLYTYSYSGGWQQPPAQYLSVPVGGIDWITFTYHEYGNAAITFQDDSGNVLPFTGDGFYCSSFYKNYSGGSYYYNYCNASLTNVATGQTYYFYRYQTALNGIPPGLYRLAPGPEDGGYTTPPVLTLRVAGGQTTTFTLVYTRPTGTITGTVHDNALTAQPLANVRVGTKNPDGSWANSTLTDALGNYTLSVQAGTPTVYAESSDSRYRAAPPRTITVANGATVTGVNFTLNRYAFITGYLYDTGSPSAPIVGVVATALQSSCWYCYYTSLQATTDAAGFFDIQVDPGRTYSVQPLVTAGFTKLLYAGGGIQEVVVANAGDVDALPANLLDQRNGTVKAYVQDDTPHALDGAPLEIQDQEYYGCGYSDNCAGAPVLVYGAASSGGGFVTLSAPVGQDTLVTDPLAGYSPQANVNFGAAAGQAVDLTAAPITYYRDATDTITVTSDTGTLPADVKVQFYGYDFIGRYYSGSQTITGGLGTVSFQLPVGNWVRVHIDDFVAGFGFAHPSYRDHYYLSAAQLIADAFNFVPFGAVAGTVLKEGGAAPGQPVHIHADVYDSNGNWHTFCSSSDTLGDPAACFGDPITGAFSLPVMEGTAYVYADTFINGFGLPGDANSTNQWVRVMVTSTATTSGISFLYNAWQTISGSATGDYSALPGPVQVYDYSYDHWARGYGYYYATTANGGGAFSFSVPPGTSYVAANTSFAHWFAPNQQQVPVALDTSVNNLSLLYIRAGTISVTLQDDSTPALLLAPGCCPAVLIQNAKRYYWLYFGNPPYNPNPGTIEVIPDTYTLTPPSIGAYLPPGAQQGILTANSTTSITFTYRLFATASGYVRNDITNAGIDGVQVCDDTNSNNCTTSSGGGHYTLNVGAGPRKLVPQRFVQGYLVADPIDLGNLISAQPVSQDVRYHPNGTASGTIRDQAGHPILAAVGLYFDYYDPISGGWLFEYQATSSAADGTYHSLSLPPGTRTIHAHSLSGYDNAPTIDVNITQATDTPSSDFTFGKHGSISGHLVSNTANPLPTNLFVQVCGPSGCPNTSTDAGGNFTFPDLSAGTYNLYLPSVTNWVTPASPPVTVVAGADTPVTRTYIEYGTLTGAVTDEDGNPVSPAPYIAFYGTGGYSNALYATTATFSIKLAPDTYRVVPYGVIWYTSPVPPEIDNVVVTSGSPTPLGQTFLYRRYVVVNVHVDGDSHPNLYGAPVQLLGPNGSQVDYQTTDASGNVTLHGAPNQDLVVRALGFTGWDAPVSPSNSVDLGTIDYDHRPATTTNFTDQHWGTVEGDLIDIGGSGLSATVSTSAGTSGPTNGTGHFSIPSPRGTWYVWPPYFPNYVNPATGQYAMVSSGQPTSLVEFTYIRYLHLSGYAQDDQTVAVRLQGVAVQAWSGNSYYGTATTDNTGLYQFDLPAEYSTGGPVLSYTLIFLAFAQAGQSYVTPASHTGFSGAPGSQPSDPNPAVYIRYGTAVGTVTGIADTTLLQQVTVTVSEDGHAAGTTSVDATGHWQLAVPPGTVTATGSLVNGFDPPLPPLPTAPVFPGTASATLTLVYTPWGNVFGTLQDNFGAIVPGASVTASSGQATSSAGDGKYRLYLPRGPTTLTAGPIPGLVAPSPLSVSSGPSTTGTEADFTVGHAYIRYGTLNLFAVDSSGPLDGAVIGDQLGHRLTTSSSDGIHHGFATESIAPPAADCVGDPSSAPADCGIYLYPQPVDGHSTAPITKIFLTSGTVTTVTLTYPTYVVVSGTLKDTNNLVVVGAAVWVTDPSSSTRIYSTLDPDGMTFHLAVPRDVVTIHAVGLSSYVTPGDQTVNTRTGVPVPSLQPFLWARYGFIFGKVSDSVTTLPIPAAVTPSVQVGAFVDNGSGTGLGYLAPSDPTGNYRIDLPPGTYSVFGGTVTNYERPGRVTGLVVTSPTNPNDLTQGIRQNLAYDPYASIKVKVEDDAHNAIGGATVSSYLSSDYGAQGVTDGSGLVTLRVPHSLAMPYTLYGLPLANYDAPAPMPNISVGIGESRDLTATPLSLSALGHGGGSRARRARPARARCDPPCALAEQPSHPLHGVQRHRRRQLPHQSARDRDR